MAKPKSLEEWASYIARLGGRPLWSKAISANSQAFMSEMINEGYTAEGVKEIILLFVRQLAATGQKIPDGGVYDPKEMAVLDPIAQQGATMTEVEVEELEASPPDEGRDDIDIALDSFADE